MAFSIDLRERVVAAIDNGNHINEVKKIFRVSRRVIYEWLELRRKTGSLAPNNGFQKGHSHNKTKREEFLEEIKQIDSTKIVYSDETGIDDNEVILTGWAPRGKRCYAHKKALRKKRYNITAALHSNVLFAPFLFEGYSNAAVYETYIEKVLMPTLQPGMVLVIDNARFHKSKNIMKLLEKIQ